MGPYMRPIPIGASAAMVFSLLVAFIVTPWAAVRILKPRRCTTHGEREDFVTRLYRRVMGALLHHAPLRWGFLGGVVVLLLGSCSLFYFEFVKVKMLPFDNKSEFQVIVDMPERHHARRDRARGATRWPRDAGAARGGQSPDLRRHRVALQLQRPGAPLLPAPRPERGRHPGESAAKDDRKLQSHEIAKQVRHAPAADRRALRRAHQGGRSAARTARAADAGRRSLRARRRTAASRIARQIRDLWSAPTAWWTSTGTWRTTSRSTASLVDKEKAALNGISEDDIARTMQLASAGYQAGLLHVGLREGGRPAECASTAPAAPTWTASRT